MVQSMSLSPSIHQKDLSLTVICGPYHPNLRWNVNRFGCSPADSVTLARRLRKVLRKPANSTAPTCDEPFGEPLGKVAGISLNAWVAAQGVALLFMNEFSEL
jgi:hypothetical protein